MQKLKAPPMRNRLPLVFALAAIAATEAAPASAISRYNTPRLSCDAIHGILDRERAAILRYPSKRKPGLTLYDRYVNSGYACPPHHVAERTTVPARDGACPVLHCVLEKDLCDMGLSPACD